MAKRTKVLFGTLSFNDLNQGNYALKNDFIENLVYIAEITSGVLQQFPHEYVEGFIPSSILKKTGRTDRFVRYHASGNALAIRYSGSLEVVKNIIINYIITNKEPISVVLTESTIRFITNGKSCLYEPDNKSYRVSFKK